MTSQHSMAVWRDCIRAWYPDYDTKSYFVPPVVITRIPFDMVTVAGQTVLVLHCNDFQASLIQPNSTRVKRHQFQECNTRDDLALQRVLVCMRNLALELKEPMFVISQLRFSHYLGKKCYAAAAKHFTRPQNLSPEYRQGDFDILVIHRRYGILTGEIKSVLANQHQLLLPQREVDCVVADRIRQAIRQLDKSIVVLREITKDLHPNLPIRKILILPYVTVDVLRRVILRDTQLQQDLVTCLQTSDIVQAIELCLLADHFAVDQQNDVNIKLQLWWTKHFVDTNDITTDLYIDLLARFCGPATTITVYCLTAPRIEVRTEGQGVAIAGDRMTSLILTPEQVRLLCNAPKKVMLTGPPGVGKSVMLVLMALKWLRQGLDVHLVSVDNASLAATHVIMNTIRMTLDNDHQTAHVKGNVHIHEHDFHNKLADVGNAINILTARKGSQKLYVICDEFLAADSRIARYQQFVTELCTRLPKVCVWVASPRYDQRPAELQEERMTIPLRCPPAVLREVEKGVNNTCTVHPYVMTTLASPCDGPNVIHFSHQGPGHSGHWPLECFKCGQSIAGILKQLGLGTMGVRNTDIVTTHVTSDNGLTDSVTFNNTAACSYLQYRDVFVLTRSIDVHDDVMDDAGRVVSQANSVVRGLRAADVPVRVIRKGHWCSDVRDTAIAKSDAVTMTNYRAVYGLERKVVVWLPDRIPIDDDNKTDDILEADSRLYAMSRCIAQLVVIDMPVSDTDRDVQT